MYLEYNKADQNTKSIIKLKLSLDCWIAISQSLIEEFDVYLKCQVMISIITVQKNNMRLIIFML